jgi:predicted DNA-binding transcriptional regulator YafY
MPKNRNALFRYRIIDRCLSNRMRSWTWRDILDEVNRKLDEEGQPAIGKTTIFEDFKDIEFRVYQAPIEKYHGEDRRIQYMRYADPDFSIEKSPISATETEILRTALQLFSRLRGLPQFEWLHEAMPRLEQQIGAKREGGDIISFDTNRDYAGAEFIQTFFMAIQHRRVLKVLYQPFSALVPDEQEFHPYHLRQYNNRWFAFGHQPGWTKSKYVNLALDRVVEITETERPYKEDDCVWEDYFHDIVGVTIHDLPPQEVRIRIMDEEQVKYIRTKPLHHSQKPIRKTEQGWFETSIKVIPNIELEKLLLSYGSRIMVLSPTTLTERMRGHAERMTAGYAALPDDTEPDAASS